MYSPRAVSSVTAEDPEGREAKAAIGAATAELVGKGRPARRGGTISRWGLEAGRDWYRWFGAQYIARLAQLAERKALNLVVVGSSPTSGGTRIFLQSSG